MVGDLQGKLAEVGRLEILEDVGDRAMAYFEQVPEEVLTAEEKSRRAQALRQIGQVRRSEGDLDGADESFRRSLELTQALAGAAPDDSDRHVELCAALFWVGKSSTTRGDIARRFRTCRSTWRLPSAGRSATPRTQSGCLSLGRHRVTSVRSWRKLEISTRQSAPTAKRAVFLFEQLDPPESHQQGEALLVLASTQDALGQTIEAKKTRNRCLAGLKNLEEDAEPWRQAQLARTFIYLDRAADANRLLPRLRQAGFWHPELDSLL